MIEIGLSTVALCGDFELMFAQPCSNRSALSVNPCVFSGAQPMAFAALQAPGSCPVVAESIVDVAGSLHWRYMPKTAAVPTSNGKLPIRYASASVKYRKQGSCLVWFVLLLPLPLVQGPLTGSFCLRPAGLRNHLSFGGLKPTPIGPIRAIWNYDCCHSLSGAFCYIRFMRMVRTGVSLQFTNAPISFGRCQPNQRHDAQ